LGYETGESGKTVLAEKLSFTLDAGTRWILTDASGTGKTTFIACAAGLRKPLAGSIDSASALSLMCQEARLVEAYTAEENVELVAALTENEARSLLLELLPKSCLGRPVSELSGGQRRRVELVRALAHASGLVLLDEPFASLDERTHKEAAAFILRHLEGRTLIVASHAQRDRELVAAEVLELFGR
jgi:NitT/TauT family transport system permease protein